MKSQNLKVRLLAVVLSLMTAFSFCYAQDAGQMNELIGQSLSKLQQDPSPEAYQACIDELKGIDATYPGSVAPLYNIALQCLNFSIRNPRAPQTTDFMADVDEAIRRMEEIPDADQSDLLTLKGFQYMVYIVQDPAFNGPLYYLDVMDYYAKALKLNPENQLAKHLQEKFYEGMAQSGF